jgi:cohesin complex subunit SCC1
MLTHFVSMLADEILSDIQGPHRILAQLLFGIVRIYSKKVYYLYHDCEEIRSLQLRQCVEPSASTGGLTHGVLKQVNKAIRAGRSVAGHKKTSKVNEPVKAVRTTEVSSPVSSEGLSVRVETEVIVRTSVVIRKARVPDDLPTFTIPKRFELDSFDLGIAEDT